MGTKLASGSPGPQAAVLFFFTHSATRSLPFPLPLHSADFSIMPITLYNFLIQMLIIIYLWFLSLLVTGFERERERESPCLLSS